MKNQILLLALIIIGGCTSNDLTIQDLKFNNSEKTPIKANKIKESKIYLDSTDIRTRFQSMDIDDSIVSLFLKTGMGTEVLRYDTNGNVIYHDIKEFMGTTQLYEFDSLQFLIKKEHITDFSAKYLINYLFESDKRRLYQIWKYGEESDTTVFTFNSSGHVINETNRMHDDKSTNRTFYKEYLYKNDTLYKTRTSFHNHYKNLSKTEESISYKNGVLNKIEIIHFYSILDRMKYPLVLKTTKEFDSKGLPFRYTETYQDGKSYIKRIVNK